MVLFERSTIIIHSCTPEDNMIDRDLAAVVAVKASGGGPEILLGSK